MARAKRRVPGWVGIAIAVLVAASLAAVARVMGASWQQIVWGAFACLAFFLLAEFAAWLTTGGPLQLERRSPEDAERRTSRPE